MSFGAFLFHLLVWAGPPALLVVSRTEWRRSAYGMIPFGFLLQGFLLGAFAAALHPALAPGWIKLFVVETLATVITWRALVWVHPRLRGLRHPVFSPKAMLYCLLGAAIASADLVAIFSGQGFAFEKGRWFHAGETYFRPPMNNDLTRHVVVTNSLLRRAESTPFLPRSRYSYQLFWHHLAALSVGPLASWWAPITNYPLVVGHVLTVAFLFFFMLLWAMHARRPSLFETPLMAISLGILVLAHADVFHFVLALLSKGAPGIEADWSVTSEPFRTFTAKLMGLTAPQHALFFFFFLGYLERRHWVSGSRGRVAFALPCFVASPILGLFIFPLWWLGEVARLYDRLPRALSLIRDSAIAVVAGIGGYVLILRENPVDLVSRPGASTTSYFPMGLSQSVLFPFLWLATCGILGLLALALTRRRRWAWPWLLLLVFGLPFFNFVVSASEVRRHFAMVVAVLSAGYLVRAFPRRAVAWERVVVLGALICLPLHAYFIFCYLGKPSSLEPSLPWQDYFAMNQVIHARFEGEPILAAVQPGDGGRIGLEKPVPMEATTSFSMPYHTAAHVKVSDEQMTVFRRIYQTGETLPYAASLGYRYTVWGPVEERVWGERNRKRFIDGNQPLATTGSVSLYALRDSLAPLAKAHRTGEEGLRYAQALEEGGFSGEAMTEYDAMATSGVQRVTALLSLARLQVGTGDPASAIKVTEWILSHDPNNAGAHSIRASALARLGRAFQAVESYRRVLEINPKDIPARNNLALILNQVGDFLGAEEQLRPLVELASPVPAPAVLINFAEALLGQQRYKEAVNPLERCLTWNLEQPLRLQAHLRLAEAYAGLQQREPASFHFREVLKLDPNSAPAQAYFHHP